MNIIVAAVLTSGAFGFTIGPCDGMAMVGTPNEVVFAETICFEIADTACYSEACVFSVTISFGEDTQLDYCDSLTCAWQGPMQVEEPLLFFCTSSVRDSMISVVAYGSLTHPMVWASANTVQCYTLVCEGSEWALSVRMELNDATEEVPATFIVCRR